MPIYNMERYLDECMKSVLSQTLQDIEIICVDDGSNDASPSMIDRYAASDSRIKVIHKANSGYGHSVNLGIEQSSGEYIGIVEPDDYIKPAMMETLYVSASENNLDMISSDFEFFYGEGKDRVHRVRKILDNPTFYNRVIDSRKENEVLTGGYINPASLFCRKFLLNNNIRHNETPGASYQDNGFRYQVLMFSKRIMLLNRTFYCYRQDNEMSSIANEEKIGCAVEEFKYVYKIMKNRDGETRWFLPVFCYRKYEGYLFVFQRIVSRMKRDFLYQMSNEFKKMNDNGELYLDYFPKWSKRTIIQIMEDPEIFLNSYMSLGTELREVLKEYDGAVIYGAGMAGKRIYDMMFEEEKKKIKGFAVTSMEDNLQVYNGVRIREISDYEPDKNNIAVIIGVMGKYRDEVWRTLEEKKFKNVIYLKSTAINI